MRMIPDLQKWQWEQNWVCRLPWQLCGPGQWQQGPSSRRKRHHSWHFTRQGSQRSPIQRSRWFVTFFFNHESMICWAKSYCIFARHYVFRTNALTLLVKPKLTNNFLKVDLQLLIVYCSHFLSHHLWQQWHRKYITHDCIFQGQKAMVGVEARSRT